MKRQWCECRGETMAIPLRIRKRANKQAADLDEDRAHKSRANSHNGLRGFHDGRDDNRVLNMSPALVDQTGGGADENRGF